MTAISPLTLGLEHQRQLDRLVAAGNDELLSLYNYAKNTGDWNAFADTLRAGYPIIYKRYSQMSDLLSTAFYTTLRENAIAGSTASPEAFKPATVYEPGQADIKAQAAVGYGISLSSRGLAEQSVKQALSGALNQGVYEQSFDSIVANIDMDDWAAEYKRIPSAKACTFCLEVGAALGEDFEEGFDSKFHANCKCVVVATFDNQRDLDLRRGNLKKYEEDRAKAVQMIQDGELEGETRAVPRDTREYSRMAEQKITNGLKDALKEEYGPRSSAYRKERDYLQQEVVPGILGRLKTKSLTREDINHLDQWGVAYDLYDDGSEKYPTLRTEIHRVSRKDLMHVMRTRFGYR